MKNLSFILSLLVIGNLFSMGHDHRRTMRQLTYKQPKEKRSFFRSVPHDLQKVRPVEHHDECLFGWLKSPNLDKKLLALAFCTMLCTIPIVAGQQTSTSQPEVFDKNTLLPLIDEALAHNQPQEVQKLIECFTGLTAQEIACYKNKRAVFSVGIELAKFLDNPKLAKFENPLKKEAEDMFSLSALHCLEEHVDQLPALYNNDPVDAIPADECLAQKRESVKEISQWIAARKLDQHHNQEVTGHAMPEVVEESSLSQRLPKIDQAVDYEGNTALIIAAINNDLELVKKLVEEDGAQVNICRYNMKSDTPIAFAAEKGHFDIVKYLLSKDIDSSAKDIALLAAAGEGHLRICKLLVENGAHINKDNGGRSGLPLIAAYRNKHRATYSWLLKQGANPHLRNMYGENIASLQDYETLLENI